MAAALDAAGQAAAAAAGVAAAAAANQDGKVSIKIDVFFGEPRDAKTPEQWAETLDRATGVNAWAPQAAAQAALEQFRGAAHTWATRLKKRGGVEAQALTTWPLLRVAFLARFQRGKTSTDKVALIAAMKQRQDEEEGDFVDRGDVAVLIAVEDELAAHCVAPNAELKKAAFVECRDTMTKLILMAGFKPEIRRKLEESAPAAGRTLEQIREAAVQLGRAAAEDRKRRGNAQIGAIEYDDGNNRPPPRQQPAASTTAVAGSREAAEFQVAAMQRAVAKQFGPKKEARTGADKSSARPAKGTGFFARMRQLPITSRDWICCNRCNQWGQHFASECKVDDQQLANMTKADRQNRPSGNAFDAQFPN